MFAVVTANAGNQELAKLKSALLLSTDARPKWGTLRPRSKGGSLMICRIEGSDRKELGGRALARPALDP